MTAAISSLSAARKVAGQIIAADPSQSVWVGANAGTGKTRVLIDRILRLLLAGVPAQRILCLTFTKAAATEMATRLNRKLGEWAVLAADPLMHDLSGLLGRDADDQTRQIARSLFAKTLDTPGGLKIRTIHSFCESLLGRFPVEAGIAPHFSIIDERATLDLRREARDQLMVAAAGDDLELGQAFDLLAALVDEDSFGKVMGELDSSRQQLESLLHRHGRVAGIVAAIRGRLDLEPDDTEEKLIENATGLDAVALQMAADVLADGSRTDQERGQIIRDWVGQPGNRLATFDQYKSVYITATGTAKASSSIITRKRQDAHPAALMALLAEQDRVLAVLERLKSLAIVAATEALLTIGERMSSTYRALKARRALLDYDDLILKAGDLLEDGRAAWVHYKLDGGIDHILVDEAQDTSPQQWRVISLLAQDFFAGDGAGDDRRALPRTVFAVGDQKQSIYSFQGADPAEFVRMREYFADRANAVERRWQQVDLSLSFRSVWTVLNLVDQVFGSDEARDGLVPDGNPVRHQSSRDGQAGQVELWPPLTPIEGPDDDPWDAPVDQLSQKSPVVRLAERIARTIRGWLDTGELLPSTGRAVTGGDIMILVRTRGQFAEEMVRQLKHRQIPVAGSDRMILLNQIAVMDLVAAGRFVLLPEDDLTLAALLKSPLVGLDDAALFDLAHGRPGSLWQALRRQRVANPQVGEVLDRLQSWLSMADFTPPYEFYSSLLNGGQGRRKLLGRLGPDAADPIDEFMNLCLDFERDHPPSLEGFLDWLEAGETQIKRDMEHGGNQVRVMTIHGAKGLQSNVVFLPDTCSMPQARQSSRLYWEKSGNDPLVFWPVVKGNEERICQALAEQLRAESLREYRRLLYVGLTRARDRVYVCGWQGKNDRDPGCWYDLVEQALRRNDQTETFDLEAGETGLRLSSAQQAPPDNISTPADDRVATTRLPEWAQVPPRDEPAPPDPLSPSHEDSAEPPVLSPLQGASTRRFQRGLLIHKLLESLPGLPPSKRRDAARRYLALPTHALERPVQQDIADETMAMLEDPALAPIFGPDSQPEVPLVGSVVTKTGVRVISAQLDRLLVSGDQVIVIDYKTNRPPPRIAADVPVAYLRQMAAYRVALRQIYPAKTVQAVLLWTDGPTVMRLEEGLLDAHEP